MGQSQSSSSGASAEPQQPSKRDYYELLVVERTATDEEIKKAYRRRALELHPDRNFGNEEGATKLFAEIQAAYEVLSDPQERAWYDSHRDVLLRGDTVGEDGTTPGADNFAYGSKMTGAEDVMKLMMRFNTRVQFTDAPTGFYGGVKEFFDTLAQEEDIAARWEGDDGMEYPPFGGKDDDYEDVVRPFYATWNGFATQKSYAWKDKWRLSDAPDRRVRRLMEKDNKKIRDDAIFEFNDAVRSLVAFVRKRDPRMTNNQKSEAERQKALKELAAAQAARSRARREAELESFDLPEWARSRDQGRDEFEGGFSSEEEEEQHEYECIVCDKTFKSEKQYQAHEKSKKHIKLLKELKREMKKQGQDLELEEAGIESVVRTATNEAEITNTTTHPSSKPRGTVPDDSDNGSQEMPTVRHLESPTQLESPQSNNLDESEDSDYAPRSKVEQRIAIDDSDVDSENISTLTSGLQTSNISTSQADTPISALSDAEHESASQPKLGKAKQKRAKKAAAAAAVNDSQPGANTAGEFRCVVCQGDFTSKTKLFNHIKEKNHAAPISQTKGQAKTGGGKGKKR
ncbi:hypothetical protein R6Q59_010191 [Mikania micrantha]